MSQNKVSVNSMEDGKQISQIVTGDNPHAIHGIAEVGKDYCIICPHRELGQLKVTWFELQEHTDASADS